MDTTQLLLTVVLTVTTILLIIVGIQLIFVLREFRRILTRVNTVITSFEEAGAGLNHGLGELQGFVGGLRSVFKVIDLLHTRKNGRSK